MMKHFIMRQEDLDLDPKFGVSIIDEYGYRFHDFTNTPILEFEDDRVVGILDSWASYIEKKSGFSRDQLDYLRRKLLKDE